MERRYHVWLWQLKVILGSYYLQFAIYFSCNIYLIVTLVAHSATRGVGTHSYAAPEQLNSKESDAKV